MRFFIRNKSPALVEEHASHWQEVKKPVLKRIHQRKSKLLVDKLLALFYLTLLDVEDEALHQKLDNVGQQKYDELNNDFTLLP